MKRPIPYFLYFGALIVIFPFAALSQVRAQESGEAKIARLLNESGMKYTKNDKAIWTIPYDGKQVANLTVIVGIQKEVLFMFAIVVEKKNYTATPELLKKLLSQNHNYDRVKIGIDGDGDIFSRIDLSVRLVDKQELIDDLDQTAATADEVFASIKPFLKTVK